MKSLPLRERHQAEGARMREEAGWEVPGGYGDPLAEYHAVRTGAGVLDLSDGGLVRMTGIDAPGVLNGVLTNDARMPPGEGCTACLLDDVGKVRLVLQAYRVEDGYLLATAPGQGEALRDAIDYYVFAEDAAVETADAAWGILSVQGPGAARVVGGDAAGPEHRHGRAEIGGVAVRVARHSRTGEDGFDVWVPRDAMGPVWDALRAAGAAPVGRDALDMLRLEAGIPRLGVDVTDAVNPLEVGLVRAISFDKGCYLGQETVARITFLSRPVKRLAGLVATAPEGGSLHPGERLLAAGKDVGWVTSAAFSPALGRPAAMGFVRSDVLDRGGTLQVADGGEAAVRKLPLYRSPALGFEPADAAAPPLPTGHKPTLPS